MATPRTRSRGIQDPPTQFVAITPSDATLINVRALYVGTAGDVRVLGSDDEDPVTFANVPAGTTLVGGFQKVLATGTTADDIVGQL